MTSSVSYHQRLRRLALLDPLRSPQLQEHQHAGATGSSAVDCCSQCCTNERDERDAYNRGGVGVVSSTLSVSVSGCAVQERNYSSSSSAEPSHLRVRPDAVYIVAAVRTAMGS